MYSRALPSTLGITKNAKNQYHQYQCVPHDVGASERFELATFWTSNHLVRRWLNFRWSNAIWTILDWKRLLVGPKFLQFLPNVPFIYLPLWAPLCGDGCRADVRWVRSELFNRRPGCRCRRWRSGGGRREMRRLRLSIRTSDKLCQQWFYSCDLISVGPLQYNVV